MNKTSKKDQEKEEDEKSESKKEEVRKTVSRKPVGIQERKRRDSKNKAARSRVKKREAYKSSEKGRREDALALRAEERRDKLRKAAGRSKYPVSRRYLNGETQLRKP